MLAEITKRDDLATYRVFYRKSSEIFLEGESSRDLFILVSGALDVLKGARKIAEISQRGSLFGEMSHWLEGGRTATVRAREDVTALRIPEEEIDAFLDRFPVVMREMVRMLSRRLKDTSQVLFGLQEVCDQLPDAVFMTGERGRILSWNHAAERLYGYRADEILYKSLAELLEDPRLCEGILDDTRALNSVQERVIRVNHPRLGLRYVSASVNVLKTSQGAPQGFIFIGRDVTANRKLESRFYRMLYWMVPVLAVSIGLGLATYYGHPYFAKGHNAFSHERRMLKDQLVRDFRFLEAGLIAADAWSSPEQARAILSAFLDSGQGEAGLYTGIFLLDPDKRVISAWSVSNPRAAEEMVGSSYSAIPFEGRKGSRFRFLTPYYVEGRVPVEKASVEIAHQVEVRGRFVGWLVLQMNMEKISGAYGLGLEDLRKLELDTL